MEQREEERREKREEGAVLSVLITLILGALFFKAENLALVETVGNRHHHTDHRPTYAAIALLGLSILFSVLAILDHAPMRPSNSDFIEAEAGRFRTGDGANCHCVGLQ
jgi:hypothetical protein